MVLAKPLVELPEQIDDRRERGDPSLSGGPAVMVEPPPSMLGELRIDEHELRGDRLARIDVIGLGPLAVFVCL
jgi:hypothetical protein